MYLIEKNCSQLPTDASITERQVLHSPELHSLADTNATPGTLSLPPGQPFGSNVTASTAFFTLGTQETSPSTFETTLVKFTPGGPGGVLPISDQFAPKLGLAVATAWCVRSEILYSPSEISLRMQGAHALCTLPHCS